MDLISMVVLMYGKTKMRVDSKVQSSAVTSPAPAPAIMCQHSHLSTGLLFVLAPPRQTTRRKLMISVVEIVLNRALVGQLVPPYLDIVG